MTSALGTGRWRYVDVEVGLMRDENSNFPQAVSHGSPAREIELKLEVPLRSLSG